LLTLREDGSLRGLWRGDAGSELSIKFIDLGDLHAALVIPCNADLLSQWAGFDDADGVIDLLYAFNIAEILFA
jgi:hypothetical protein